MKTMLLNPLLEILPIASSVLVLIPILLMLLGRNMKRSYTFTLGLSFLVFFLNTMAHNSFIQLEPESAMTVAKVGMMLQPLLTILFLKHLVYNKELKRDVMAGMWITLMVNILLLGIFGMESEAIFITFLSGLLLCAFFGTLIFMRLLEEYRKPRQGMGKFLMIIGVLFMHASLLLSWWVRSRSPLADSIAADSVYQGVIMLFSVLITAGIVMDTRVAAASSHKNSDQPMVGLKES